MADPKKTDAARTRWGCDQMDTELDEHMTQTTAVAGDQWTPKTLMDSCMHIRSLEAEREAFRQDASRWRGLLQDVVDDMTFNVAPSKGTMAKIGEALQHG